MRDLVFVSLIVGFFALMTLYLKACISIVGADSPSPDSIGSDSTSDFDREMLTTGAQR